MITILAWVGLFNWNTVPEDRNIFEGKTHECCTIYDKSICSVTVEDAYYKDNCINKKEYEIAKEKNLMVACKLGKLGNSCLCGCLDPSSLIRVWDKGSELWKDVPIETLEKNPSGYEVMAGSYEKGEIQISKAAFEVLTCAPKPLLEIQFSNHTKVLVSEEHPFHNAFGKVLRADELDIGDKIPTEDATLLIQKIIKKSPNPKGVMNIFIKGKDNQRFILANGVWTNDAKTQKDMH